MPGTAPTDGPAHRRMTLSMKFVAENESWLGTPNNPLSSFKLPWVEREYRVARDFQVYCREEFDAWYGWKGSLFWAGATRECHLKRHIRLLRTLRACVYCLRRRLWIKTLYELEHRDHLPLPAPALEKIKEALNV